MNVAIDALGLTVEQRKALEQVACGLVHFAKRPALRFRELADLGLVDIGLIGGSRPGCYGAFVAGLSAGGVAWLRKNAGFKGE